MSLPSDTATLELPLLVENDLEVDNDGRFFVVSYIFPDESDDSVEIRVEFEQIIDNLIDFYREEQGQAGDYGQLYLIAHELDRHAHTLRDIAGLMEGKLQNEDLFDDL
jgi:meiotically up-regulated gene 157 (Mug157) protein